MCFGVDIHWRGLLLFIFVERESSFIWYGFHNHRQQSGRDRGEDNRGHRDGHRDGNRESVRADNDHDDHDDRSGGDHGGSC